MHPDSLLRDSLVVAHHAGYTHFWSMIVWFILGLLFVYLEVWMKQEVDESLNGPFVFAKTHARSVAFALMSYVAIFSLWLSNGINIDLNGENFLALEKGKINGMIVFIGYGSSAIFTTIASKFSKVRSQYSARADNQTYQPIQQGGQETPTETEQGDKIDHGEGL